MSMWKPYEAAMQRGAVMRIRGHEGGCTCLNCKASTWFGAESSPATVPGSGVPGAGDYSLAPGVSPNP